MDCVLSEHDDRSEMIFMMVFAHSDAKSVMWIMVAWPANFVMVGFKGLTLTAAQV